MSKLQSLIYLSMNMIDKDSELRKGLPELVYLLDHESLVRLLKVVGGRTIRIPTLNEVALSLLTAVCTYKVIKEHLTLENIFESYDLPKSYRDYIIEKHKAFMENITKEELQFINSL